MENTKNLSWVLLFKILGYFVLFYLCYNAKIMGTILPAFYGLFLSLLFLGENPFYLSLSFVCSSVLFDSSTQGIIFALICSVFGSFIALFYKKTSKNFAVWKKCIYTFVIGLCYVLLQYNSLSQIYISSSNVILNTLFMLCCSNFFNIVIVRKFNFNLNVDEIVCGAIILSVLFCGLANFNLPIDLVKLCGFSLILFCFSTFPGSFGVVTACVCGLGAFVSNGNPSYITLFSMVSLFNYIFKSQNRIYAILSTIIVDIMLCAVLELFGEVGVFTFLPTIVVCFAYYFVPATIFSKLKNMFFVDSENSSLKNILNQNKLQTSKKLLYTAEVFYEMDKSFRKLVKGNLEPSTAKTMLCNELIRENCETCHLKNRCLKSFNSEHKKVFESLINVGFEKGKITLVDLPQYLTSRCTRLGQLVNSFNSLLGDYRNYSRMTSDLDSSKLLVAEQLKGISHVLSTLSSQAQETVAVDKKLEKQIKENLIYHDIVPTEVVCFEKDAQTSVVSLMLRSIDFDNEKILKVLNKICRHKMVLDEITPANDGALTYLSYKTAPIYDIAVGIASEAKGGSEINGDNHSLVKLNEEKVMLALCDGMGSGEKAHEKSETSLNIIENFYKAGFDDETIISSVNKLLNINSENVFSALDLSVVNLKSGEIDFIKQGATVGFVKSGNEVHKIESSSLPLGVLQNVSPKITKTVLSPEDTVVMMSDGVVDAIGEDKLQEYISCLSQKNPQEVAENILCHAKSIQKNYAQDDMTVIACKIFYNAS